jgi:cell shape-determining protein MreC
MTSPPGPGAKRRFVLLLLVAVLGSAYLSRASHHSAQETGRPTAIPERLIAALLAPGERMAARATRGLRDVLGACFVPRALRRESDQLALDVEDLRQATAALRAYTAEYEGESSVLASDVDALTRSIENGLMVRVLGSDPTGRRQLLLLDAGAKDQVTREMGVVIGPDLIGRIERVNRSTSVAHLCTDREFSIPVRCLRSGDYLGTLVGDGGEGMHVYGLPSDSDVREGDLLTTAPSLEGLPAELRVGAVERVTLVPGTDGGAEGEHQATGTLLIHALPLARLRGASRVEIVPNVSYGD